MPRDRFRRFLAKYNIAVKKLGFRLCQGDVSQNMEYSFMRAIIRDDWPKIIVDIGANDGRTYSNSFNLLKDCGWRGILVEPNCDLRPLIEANLKGTDYQLFSVAASSDEGIVELHFDNSGDAKQQMASVSSDRNRWFDAVLSGRSVKVPTARLCSILEVSGVPRDFGILSVDTEGHDLEVLRGLGEWRPRLIVSEIYAWNKETYRKKFQWCFDNGYLFVTQIGCNEVFVRVDCFAPGTYHCVGHHM